MTAVWQCEQRSHERRKADTPLPGKSPGSRGRLIAIAGPFLLRSVRSIIRRLACTALCLQRARSILPLLICHPRANHKPLRTSPPSQYMMMMMMMMMNYAIKTRPRRAFGKRPPAPGKPKPSQ